MRNIIIPEIDFRQANIRVVEFLAQMSTQVDNGAVDEGGMRGVNSISNLGHAGDAPAAGGMAAPVEDDRRLLLIL